MKYIILEDFSGQPAPFLFPDKVAHIDMRDQLPYANLLSAGYIALVDGRMVCSSGHAELNMSSRPEDAECITEFFIRRSAGTR